MKHRAQMITPVALVAALAVGAWSPAGAAAQAPNAASESKPSQQELQKKLDEARAQLDKSAREVAELSMQLGGDGGRTFIYRGFEGPPPRAVIGVQIANGAGDGGARVLEVSPGGAAADAGIKVGDIITSIGGEDISKDPDPGRALVGRMSQIDPNLKVQVGVLRDGRKMTFDVTPRPAPVQTFRLERRGGPDGGPGPGVVPFPGPGMPGVPGIGGPLQRREIIINRGDEAGLGMRFRGI